MNAIMREQFARDLGMTQFGTMTDMHILGGALGAMPHSFGMMRGGGMMGSWDGRGGMMGGWRGMPGWNSTSAPTAPETQ
jgi:hypothetical protein